MMRRKSRVVFCAVLALALAATTGLMEQGFAGPGTSSDAKVSAATGPGCPSAKAGGCPSAAKGCPGAAVGGCAGVTGTKAGATGCPSGMAGTTGTLAMPEGTKMTRMDVEGGIDLIFTGKDLAAIRSSLDGYIAASAAAKGKSCAVPACTVATSENSVVLSARGPNAEPCSTMLLAALSGEAAKAAPAKPAKKKWSLWKRG